MSDGKRLVTSYHSKTRRKVMKRGQFQALYKKLQFKKVVKKFQAVPQVNQKLSKKSKKGKNAGDKAGKNQGRKLWRESKDPIDVLIEPLELPTNLYVNQSMSTVVQMKTETSFFGCEKNTKSCIGQIYNDVPFYQHMIPPRHTPPCCLEKLKNVFLYLIEELENTGIRYW